MNSLAWEVKYLISATRISMTLHLYSSLLYTKQLTLWERRFSGINLPARHGPIVSRTRACRRSPFAPLVPIAVALSVTPRKSRCSDSVKKLKGIMSCFRVDRHFESGKNLHFWDSGLRCMMQPDDSSNIVITRSTR